MDASKLQISIPTIWAVLSVVGRWLLLRKAGRPGWHSIIPILSDFEEFGICWKGGKLFLAFLLMVAGVACLHYGQQNYILVIVGGILLLWVLTIHWRESMKLARSFGKGAFTGFLLFLTDRLGRVILGLSAAEYVGKP